ncbi:MAG: hypothetical protein HY822_04840 [Acidobacteria bacterium]|nr:hypothetical protein [Acidobacteriota bacterium]
MPWHPIRLAYAAEFLLALMVILFAWGEIAGPGQLEFVPWHWKAGLSLCLALAVVRATAAAVEAENGWNPRLLRWLLVAAALVLSSGLVTLHYQSEAPAEEETGIVEESTVTGVTPGHPPADVNPRPLLSTI